MSSVGGAVSMNWGCFRRRLSVSLAWISYGLVGDAFAYAFPLVWFRDRWEALASGRQSKVRALPVAVCLGFWLSSFIMPTMQSLSMASPPRYLSHADLSGVTSQTTPTI